MRMTVATAVACLLGVGISTAHDAQAAIKQGTTIPAQGLGAALKQLAGERDIQLVYRSEVVGEHQTGGAVGELTFDEALTKLLQGTGLTYQYLDDRAVTIVPMGASSSAPIRLAQAEPVYSASQASANESERRASLEEIIVTAQKVAQREIDVPSSLTVVSGAELESHGVSQLSDLVKFVPGLRINGEGGPGEGALVLRGMSTSGRDRNPTVGVYLDDVPFTPSSTRSLITLLTFDPAMADIERVEVLKGPQSTLYGANALTGLIKYVSKRPSLTDFEASLRTEGMNIDDGGTGYLVRGSANIPIAEDVAGARVTAYYRKEPGFVDNTLLGRDDVNESTVKGVRASVLFKIGEKFENTVSGLAQDIRTEGKRAFFINRADYQPSLGGLTYQSPIEEFFDIRFRSISNTAVLDMSFATLTNITSYASFTADYLDDLSFFAAFIPPAIAPQTVPGLAIPESKRWSNELRLASAPARFEWQLGAFYTDETPHNDTIYRGGDANGNVLPPTHPAYDMWTFFSEGSYEEWAIFANATYDLTDRLELMLGGRYSENKQDFHIGGTGLLSGPPQAGRSTDSDENYLAALTYKLTPETNIYARAASAYRPGGPIVLTAQLLAAGVQPRYEADTLWNYEGGIKGSAFDGRFTYRFAGYYMDWKDVQVTTALPGVNGSFIGNVGRAENTGAELELAMRPLEPLTLSVAAAYNDNKIRVDNAGLSANKGEPLPYSPELTGSMSADYQTVLGANVVARAGLTFLYTDALNTSFPGNRNYFRLPSYNSWDFRCGLDWSRYKLDLRVDNLTNEYALADVRITNYIGTPIAGTIIRPRTVSLAFEVQF